MIVKKKQYTKVDHKKSTKNMSKEIVIGGLTMMVNGSP